MRNFKKTLLVVFVVLLFVSCASTPKFIFEALSNTKFNESLSEKEISRKTDENIYPFTVNYKIVWQCWKIKKQISKSVKKNAS